jgi:hypothetical protein
MADTSEAPSPTDRWRRSEPRGIVVLGMHRSGTSLATGLLGMAGFGLPSVNRHRPSEFNPRGNQEAMDLTRFNEHLLNILGGEWCAPPELHANWWTEPRIARRTPRADKRFQASFPDAGWVWKDPRTCLTLPFWVEGLGLEPVGVLVVRNPLETAASLERRDHFDPALSFALWERYLRAALAVAEGRPLAVLCYDDLLREPVESSDRLREFAEHHGVTAHEAAETTDRSDFVGRSYRHSNHTRADLVGHPAFTEPMLALHDALGELTGLHESFEVPALPDPDPDATQLLGRWRDERRLRRIAGRPARTLKAWARRMLPSQPAQDD